MKPEPRYAEFADEREGQPKRWRDIHGRFRFTLRPCEVCRKLYVPTTGTQRRCSTCRKHGHFGPQLCECGHCAACAARRRHQLAADPQLPTCHEACLALEALCPWLAGAEHTDKPGPKSLSAKQIFRGPLRPPLAQNSTGGICS